MSVDPGRAYQRKDGTEVEPVRLKLLAGSAVLSVEYESATACAAALDGAPVRGDVVMVPVFASGPWDAEARRRGPVFFAGRRQGRDE